MRAVVRVAVVFAATCACTWALWQWAYVPHWCNARVTSLRDRTAGASELRTTYEREQRADQNLEALHELRDCCRTEVRVPFLIGANERIAGRHDRALAAFREALAVDQRPEIHYAISGELILLGRTDEAVESYVTAERFGAHSRGEVTSEEVLRRAEERLRAR